MRTLRRWSLIIIYAICAKVTVVPVTQVPINHSAQGECAKPPAAFFAVQKSPQFFRLTDTMTVVGHLDGVKSSEAGLDKRNCD